MSDFPHHCGATQAEVERLRGELHSANQRILTLEIRIRALARAGKHLALATPDKVLRAELERAVKLANEVLPQESTT